MLYFIYTIKKIFLFWYEILYDNISMWLSFQSSCKAWTNDHYGDIALLLSKCEDVYSAEVPIAMAVSFDI